MATTTHYDDIVVGVGGMGSAAVYQLASRGRKVLGLEQFELAHSLGSSHGETRIIRLAYYEHPSYVPLMRRAYQLWRELMQAAGRPLLNLTGSIDAGPPGGVVFDGSLASCEQHGLPHEVLTSAQLTARFPGYGLPDETMAVLQPDGGYLLPEACITAYSALAGEAGAEVHQREAVLGWEPHGDGVRVTTVRATYEAERLVVTAGAWAGKLVAELAGLCAPERQVLTWFQPQKPEQFAPERFPVFNLEVDEGHFYGFPLPVSGLKGFKLGRYHHLDEQVDPDHVDREPNARDEALLRAHAERYFPAAAGPTMAMKVCMFTNSPDEDFILDVHPDAPQVSFAAGFSGHGFKFASLVGEVMADLAQRGETRHDVSRFRLDRFAQTKLPSG